jgi:long-chain acyl-CoA synthetase
MLLKEYYKRPDATAESINADGYFMTGDAGFSTTTATSRSSTAPRMSASWPTAPCSRPTTSRTSSSSSPHQGGGLLRSSREMVCAFINIDIGAVGNWAERRGIAYSGYTDLAAKPEVSG